MIESLEVSLSDWLRYPSFGVAGSAISITFLVVLGAFLIAAMWPIAIPGPATRAERNVRGKGRRVLGGFTLLFPFLLCGAFAYLHIAISRPNLVVLSSRARAQSIDGDTTWSDKWKERLERFDYSSAIDAGPIVDEVCSGIWRMNLYTGSSRYSGEAMDKLREYTFKIVSERVKSLKSRHTKEIHEAVGVPSELPRWVVDSIEIAVLKAISQAKNTKAFVVQVEDRGTGAIEVWSPAIAAYLASGTARITSPNLFADPPVMSTLPIWLDGVSSLDTANGKVEAMAIFRIVPELAAKLSASEWSNASKLNITDKDEQRSIDEFQVELVQNRQIQTVRVSRNVSVGLEESLFLRHPLSGRKFQIIGRKSGLGATTVGPKQSDRISIVVPSDAQLRVAATLSTFKGDAYKSFRDQLGNALLIRSIGSIDRFSMGSNLPAEGVVIDFTREGIWVYDVSFRTELANYHVKEGTKPDRAYRARSGKSDVPGILAWDGVQVPPNMRWYYPLDAIAGDTIAWLYPLGKDGGNPAVAYGNGPYSEEVTRQLVMSFKALATKPDFPVNSGRITFIGLDPMESGLVLNADGSMPEGFDSARFNAAWMTIFRGIDRAHENRVKSDAAGDLRGSADSIPRLLFKSGEIAQLRANSLSLPLAAATISMIGFGFWTIFASASVRRR